MEKKRSIKEITGRFNRAQTHFVISFIYLMRKNKNLPESQKHLLDLLEQGLEDLAEWDL